jgi:hypothetical protein
MFVDHAPIQDLSTLFYDGQRVSLSPVDAAIAASEVTLSIAMKCRSLKRIHLDVKLPSWDSIREVVECCRKLEEIFLYENYQSTPLTKSEFIAISSLPRLKSLALGFCKVEEGATFPLARCKGLRYLQGTYIEFPIDMIREIGGNLVSLRCSPGNGGLEKIVKHCPNLKDLDIRFEEEDSGDDYGHWDDRGYELSDAEDDEYSARRDIEKAKKRELDDESRALAGRFIKTKLKRLSKLVINKRKVRI